MVLGDYGTADFRKYRTSLQYIYKCKKNKAQDAERRKQSRKGKRNKADQDMIQKRISCRKEETQFRAERFYGFSEAFF